MAVVNVQNKDNQCFKWAVLYKKLENELDFTGKSFPVNLDDISKFEKQNDLAVSVYSVKQDGK